MAILLPVAKAQYDEFPPVCWASGGRFTSSVLPRLLVQYLAMSRFTLPCSSFPVSMLGLGEIEFTRDGSEPCPMRHSL